MLPAGSRPRASTVSAQELDAAERQWHRDSVEHRDRPITSRLAADADSKWAQEAKERAVAAPA